jgi:predicted DNA-binding transcriptional regulator YafY
VTPLALIIGDPALCKKCVKAKHNKLCSLRMCKKCCTNDPATCTLQNHQVSKSIKVPSDLIKQIDDAIKNKRFISIVYNGGEHPGTERVVAPTHWIVNGASFQAIYQNTNKQKKYLTSRIMSLHNKCLP